MPRLTSAAARLSGAPIVFALLVVATFAAFFVTTRLKRSAPVVEELTFARYLSPNGDHRHDFVDIGFQIKKSDEVTLEVLSSGGDVIRVLARDRPLDAGRSRFRWYGRTDAGTVAPDGEYRLRVGLRKQGRSVTSRRKLFVDTTPPHPVVRYVSPATISPDGSGTNNVARMRFNGPLRNRPALLVYRTDLRRPRLVARRAGKAGSPQLTWDGLVGLGTERRAAAAGNYAMVVQVEDAAGNRSPGGLPPTRSLVSGHPGLIVRYISAIGPTGAVNAGDIAALAVQSDGRHYKWRLHRLGSVHVFDRGTSSARTLHLRTPRGRSGVFIVSLRVGHHRYRVPLAVQAHKHRPVLVVLPATTWQARNPADVDGDGFADTLPENQAVSVHRPFAGEGLAFAFGAGAAPLLLELDRLRLRYDLTSDLAIEQGLSNLSNRYRGVLFVGAPRFFGFRTGKLLQSYLRYGGRLAWIGTGGLTQPTQVTKASMLIAHNGVSTARNLLGERLRPFPTGGPLTVLSDRIRFFEGAAGLGLFSRLEQSVRLPSGGVLLASAGDVPDRPSLVVYRRGRGVVVRVGADGFAHSATSSPSVARIMRRLWTLLSQ